MSQTYVVGVVGATFASGKSMLSLWNGSSSGRILRVKRVWFLNNQTAAVTGVITTMELRRISTHSGGTGQTPVKYDTNSENMPAQVAAATGATVTNSDIFRRWLWSNDEPGAGSGTNDEMECVIPLNCVFDSATGDADVEPIVLREGQGISLYHSGSSAVGVADAFIEFTMAST